MRSAGKRGEQGRKAPGPARSPLRLPPPRWGCRGAGKGAGQILERNLESKSSVSGEREPSAASCCWEIKSDDHRETTSALGSLAAVGDTDCENPGPQSMACSGSGRRWWGDFSICGAGGGMEGPDSKRGRGEKTQHRSSRSPGLFINASQALLQRPTSSYHYVHYANEVQVPARL